MKKTEKKDLNRIYQGDVTIRSAQQWKNFRNKYDQVNGSIYMHDCTGLTSVTFPKEVKGSIYMNDCTGLTSVTFPKEVNGSIYMNDKSSDYLLSLVHKKIVYRIDDVEMPRDLFDAIQTGSLWPAEVFSIKNMEQRRIAYQHMDKSRMASLPNFTVHDSATDKYGNPHRIISFTVKGFDLPFIYYHCVCPSTGREYYLETKQRTCAAAKAASFGMSEIEFTEEW